MTLALLIGLLHLPANVSSGDAAFFRIDYDAAIASYEQQLQTFPDDPELLWRLARVYVCAGEVQEEGSAEPMFRLAEQFAQRCIRADSLSAEGHTWLAAALGYRALSAPVDEQVDLSHQLLVETARALALKPDNDAAYSIRGSFYRALGNVGWVRRQLASMFIGTLPTGGYEEAQEALLKAIAIAPDVMRHHYELGVLYLDWGRDHDARMAFERAALLPVRVAIDKPRLAKIKAFLASLSGPN